ncbi:MAG: serine/threonine-protein kinase [bacterium]
MGKTNTSRWQVRDRIADRYEIYQVLGGGMGIVYVCYDHEFKIPVALKTFQEQYLFSEDGQRLFEREALVWTELERHPYIVRAHWVGRLEGRLFIFLEYIPPDRQRRNTLSHYLLGDLTLQEVLKFSIQFCYGMEYAYSKGIDCHRDIKPDNIMITSNKTVKISDFGLAKAFQEIEFKGDVITEGVSSLSIFRSKGKRVCGTLPYMAPEQFEGVTDKRSDVYSFGIVLYQMAGNGRLPFVGSSIKEYERLHRYGKIPLLPSPLFSIIKRCLEKEPDKRYQDFTSIREELENLLLKEIGERITPPEREELEAGELYNKGAALLNLGRLQEAVSCFDKALKINPRDAEVWYNKGFALGNLGRHQEAISCYDEALAINPRYAEAWGNKGNVLRRLGKHQEAISYFDEILKINPREALAWYNKGLALGNLGRHQEAIFCCDKALEINPRLTETWNNKGSALGNLGRHQEAISCFDKALKINPKDAEAWYSKGNALVNLGKSEEAISCYDEALEINRRYAEAWSNKGGALGKLGRYEEAISCCDEALEINPRLAEAWINKGFALDNLGRHEEAISCYDKALEINPRLAEAWINKGIALGNLGRYEEAISCFDKALEINPRYAEAWYNKGLALAKLRRFQKALECIDEAIRLNPDLPMVHQLKQMILQDLRR